MRLILCLLSLAALTLSAATASAVESGNISVRGILVAASREPGDTDRRLARYEQTLRKILRFESFQQLGAGRGSAEIPGEGRLSLGQGHSLEFTTEASPGNNIRVRVQWRGGNRNLMRTGLVLRPGVPAVLGGPSRNDDEVFAVILIAE